MQKHITPEAGFAEALQRKSQAYLHTKNNGQYATPFGLLKCVAFLALYAFAYASFLFESHSFSSMLGWASLLGLCHVLIPVTIAHDAIHGSLSRRRWVNRAALYTMELTGANSYMYRKKHLEAHSNKEQGNKADTIAAQGLLLQKEKNEKKVNLPYTFYLFYAEYMIFIRDFQLFSREADAIPANKWATLYVSKIFYAAAFLVLPFYFIALPVWAIISSLLLLYLVVTVLLVIILLMPTEKVQNSKGNEGHFNDAWSLEILAQNVDFSPGSKPLNWAAGGANLNVVHYLFPTVHHMHYNKLALLVEETALEYGQLYRKQNVKDVIGIHFHYIKNIGRPENYVPANGAKQHT